MAKKRRFVCDEFIAALTSTEPTLCASDSVSYPFYHRQLIKDDSWLNLFNSRVPMVRCASTVGMEIAIFRIPQPLNINLNLIPTLASAKPLKRAGTSILFPRQYRQHTELLSSQVRAFAFTPTRAYTVPINNAFIEDNFSSAVTPAFPSRHASL